MKRENGIMDREPFTLQDARPLSPHVSPAFTRSPFACLLQRPVDLVDRRQAGNMLAGFDAAQVLDANAGQFCQIALRQPNSHAVADDLAARLARAYSTAG